MQVYYHTTGYVRIYKYAMKGVRKENLSTFSLQRRLVMGSNRLTLSITYHLNKGI